MARKARRKSSSRHGVHSHDGLLCAPDGCPVAIEVFDGNTGDPTTLAPQIGKLKQRFGLDHVVLVGDRGMIPRLAIPTASPLEPWPALPRRASQKTSNRQAWTGSLRCVPRRSRTC
jgi:hypothetical protein